MPKQLLSLGGDGGGARGTATALGTITLSPLIEPAVRQMVNEVVEKWLVGWTPDFQANTALLLSMGIMLLVGFGATKAAHVSRGKNGTAQVSQ